jgi:hypothetical protein
MASGAGIGRIPSDTYYGGTMNATTIAVVALILAVIALVILL